ncbi:MAG: hypothetical protein HXX08_15915 [Chloroflexi bacterium]|uniref:YfhO family protein n=1 Tax=Candidatus Chlorohelix allophototropha TaxID=3003348 RepID=A0A8T7M5H4_9CHLR|nr:hypothetical protein [Chloroflexota bacterium]WJW69260.1 hypothetical protein OZ401_002863 [Chloroflexota bacterium L227-S17]
MSLSRLVFSRIENSDKNTPVATIARKKSFSELLVSTRHALWAGSESPVPMQRTERFKLLALRHLLPFGIYLAITIVITFPLILNFNSQVQGDNSDAWQNIWNYWWLGKSLGEFRLPFTTDMLYAPYGVPLYLDTLNISNGLIGLPIMILFGAVAAYNFIALVAFSLAGYWTYLLVSYVSGNRLAGFVGGIIYAFSSYQLTQYYLGQANLYASGWLPAYFYSLIAANNTKGRQRTLYTLLGLASLVLIMLTDWQYVIFAGLFTLFYTFYIAIGRRSFVPFVIAASIGLVWLALAAPLIFKTFDIINSKIVDTPYYAFSVSYSADLFSFVLPSPRHFIWGDWSKGINSGATDLEHNKAIFIGLLPVLLSLIGIRYQFKRSLFWVFLALLFAILALGPLLQTGGTLHEDISLPFSILQNIPGINFARVPVRFVLITVLSFSILAGYAIATLLPKIKNIKWQVGLAGLIAVLLLGEHLPAPYPINAALSQPYYQQIGSSTEKGAVLELPYTRTRAQSLYNQTIHQHPIIGGYLSRNIEYPIVDLPPLGKMPTGSSNDIILNPPSEQEIGSRALAFAGVHWLSFLLDDPTLTTPWMENFVKLFAVPTPLYQDDKMAVYRPTQVQDMSKPLFVFDLKGGWHEAENAPDLQPSGKVRWFDKRGGSYVWNLSDRTQSANLEFEIWSFNRPRTLTIRVDNVDIGSWQINEKKKLSIPLTLSAGRHQLEFRSPLEDSQSPADLGLGNDKRKLSMAVTNLTLKTANQN